MKNSLPGLIQVSGYKQEQKALKEDRYQLEQHLREQMVKLRAANEQLQDEIVKREQAERQLSLTQSRLDNINVIVHKHL